VKLLDISNPFDAPVYHEETVTSTMEVSRLLARNGAPLGASPHGTVITADFQEAGRGRISGRRWETEKGNALAFTILLRFPNRCGIAIPAGLTLRAGLAAVLAIEEFAPALSGKALIKWPNDILLPALSSDGEPSALKAAGILAEAENGSVHIGMGVNVSQKQMPASLRGKATSISMASGEDYNGGDRYKLLEKILSRLRDEIIADDWRERVEVRLYKKGGQVCFAKGAADSGEFVTGVIAGLGAEGELLIVPPGESAPLAFTAGEVITVPVSWYTSP
jgi:BirA family transcriptional regulator, biotin operon repressor / biotin---[acetyl-CoA-carboxylase] ligase